ncbi:MAG: hypothetical protein OEQ53_21240 [Saprospiraceae bacterium]|nr:hypothetical protein [Saprospiraceae bacterium]
MLLLYVLAITAVFHDLHLSKTLLHYNAQRHSLEVSVHIFTDDLENAIALTRTSPLHLETSQEVEDADLHITQYIKDRFVILVDSQHAELKFVGREPSNDLLAIWCYFETMDITPPDELIIENKLLLDLFDDQKNLMNITGPGLQKYFLFDKKEVKTTIKM